MVSSNETLRASEFVVTLNGDNHQAILKVLKQFRRTVKKERQIALALDDDSIGGDDNDWSDDEMDALDAATVDVDTTGPPAKKYKKSEEWKVDTASYDVPFVGTAVARGEQAEFTKGEWPTGLIKAYLESSPLALELLNDDLAPDGQIHRALLKKKKVKLSRAICKAHYLAIAELLTVAIPKHKLQEISSDENEDQFVGTDINGNFLKGFTKAHLPRLFNILNEETERGRGKPGEIGGCDLLVAPALKVLKRFTMISISNARLVARYLDESILDGVLRVCLRPLHVNQEVPSNSSNNSITNSKPARMEAIFLATCLLDARDAAVNTYICTGGSKERKVKPGILFIALREGLATSYPNNDRNDNDNYNDAAADMLEHLRISMFTGSKLKNPRLLFNLMARDPLQHLCRLSSHAPPLTKKRNFIEVLDGKDDENMDLDSTLVNLGVEARRLLFPLLSDRITSPFLPKFGSEQVARSMVRLLESENIGIELRRFLLYCTKKNPSLIEDLFKLLAIPDPKNSFGFISRASFIALLLSKGPSPIACVSSTAGKRKICIRDILSILFPIKLKGQFLARSLQNGNNLVRLESFKMIMIILKRFRSLRLEGGRRYKWDEGFIKMLTLATFQWLPDLQILLSLRSRFDGISGSRCGSILSGYLFRVIEDYIITLPSLVRRVNFDWMKLLPCNASKFNQALPFLQVRILSCLQIIIKSCQHDLDHLLLSSKIIFEVMLSTKSKQINSMCREIIMRLMSTVLVPRGTNNYISKCIREEVSIWIDAISDTTLPTIFKLFRQILNNSSTQLAFLGKSWKVYKVPKNMNFSYLLVAAFSTADDSSRLFAILIGQVTARCLASLRDPLSLAAVIIYADKTKSCVTQNQFLTPLVTYAQAILDFYKEDNKKRMSHSATFLSSYFDNDSPYSDISSFLIGAKSFDTLESSDGKGLMCLSPMRLIAFTKILNHTFIFSGDHGSSKERFWQIIRRIVPSLLLKYPLSTTVERKLSSLLADIYAIQKKTPYPEFDELDMLILSCPFSTSNDFIKMRKSAFIDAVYKSRNVIFLNRQERSKLLRIGLLKNNLNSQSTLKIQLSLISDTRNTFSYICLQFLNCCFGIEPEHFGEQFALENELLETAVNAWIWVGKDSQRYGNLIHRRIKGSISLMLAYSLKKETVKSAFLLSLIGKYPESLVLDLCLDFSIEEKPLVFAEIEFLNNLLRTDSYRFMNPMLSCLKDMGPRILNAWEAGHLDDSVSILLRQVKSPPETSKSLFEVIASKVSKRFIESLTLMEIPALNGITPLLNLMRTIFDTGSTIAIDTHLIASEVINILSLSFKRQNTECYGDGTKSLCYFGICILEYLKANDMQSEELSKRLSSELFYFLFASLPKVLKKNALHKSTTLPSDLVLTWLIHLINENSDHFFSRKIETSVSQKVCRACLKHGVAAGNDADKVPTLSLHFMGLLMMKVLHKDFSGTPANPTAEEVFHMIVSHSKFEQLFTDVENEEVDMSTTKSKAKEYILKLMITCVMISINDIEIKPVVWKVIFASFNAGLSHIDILIRNLVSISCKDSLPFMDELHWRGCDRNNQEQLLTGKLDWLVDALDVTRIRATTSRFPIFDRLDLAISLDSIWVEQSFHKMLEQIETPMEMRQPLSEFLKLEQQSNLVDLSSKDGELGDTEQYSPAFLLPLLLQTIEVGLNRNKRMAFNEFRTGRSRDGEDNQESMTPWIFSKASIESIQQLCEKGIVSLCLASLSSLCEKVRCYAVSILGLILQACHTNYALDSPSWRDRPQLVMILNSVQRSLVLHKALDEVDAIVPRVTPVIATFLARAATVLPKPDDALYVPMNRYFLKNETNHGAFKDMKRLPAFMSLFCSSSEDSNQSRAERMWGLQMLCDGIVNASCYRLVASCHAPELILSSFENVRLSQASDEAKGAEICLLLDSLKSMIDHGEYRAHVHLIRRCGLLSWMSSICTSRSITTAFPTERSKISFCHLTNSVVERVFCTHRLRSSELVDEMCSLIQPIVSLCLIKCHTGQSSRGIYQASFLTLRALAIGLQSMRDEKFLCPDILPLGVPLESSLRVLRIADDSMKALSLYTLCCLPVSLRRDLQQETAQHLIILMLDYFDNISNKDDRESSPSAIVDSDQLITLLLQRILLLIEQCEIVLPSSKSMINDIVTKIFALRCKARFSELNIRALWSRCLELLTRKVYNDGTEIESLEERIRKEVGKRQNL